MLPVEIVPVDATTLVLRARGSELLILPHHIGQLKAFKSPKEFTGYFLANALLNRPARKLFEAWLRKDKSLWQRIYRTIQNDMDAQKIKEFEERMNAAEQETVADSKPVKAEAAKAEAKAKPAKKVTPEQDVESKKKAPAAKPKKAEIEEKAPAKKKAAAPAAKKKDAKPAEKPKKEKDSKKDAAPKKSAAPKKAKK